ncbi:MliC family protein [Shewanella sp.]|uniref:MliC family protein n=1 Tax=Shewanella sp. TaxID=50422 RepID=UPI003A97853D
MMHNTTTLALFAMLFFVTGCQQLAPQSSASAPSSQFVCRNGESFIVKFDNQQQEAIIHYRDQTITLPQQPTASGFRYANAQQEIRGKGNQLTASFAPEQQLECVAYP